ncbi:MAG: radical SAM protein, partial [Desulfobacteraceae bacterium]
DRTSYIVKRNPNHGRLWQNKAPLLPRLDMELTERCNNKCIHCYINQAENENRIPEKEMSTDRVKEILDQAAALGCLTVRFTGGEPLLREDFADIYLYTRRLGIKVRLCTNATRITSELAALMKRYPPGEPVEITLYGTSEESYESVSRVTGSFDAAMKGIERLEKNSVPFAVKGIRLPGRDRDMERVRAFAESHSVRERISGVSVNFNLRARRDNPEKNQLIRKLRATPEDTLKILTLDRERFIKEKKEFVSKFMRPGGTDLFNCGCGNGGTVDAYGNLQPCLLLRHPDTVYDLENGSIRDALENFFPEMRKMKAENPEYLSRCARCFLHGLCEQCPAHSWMESGTLDTPVEYLCRVVHEQARFLGLIVAGENAWEVEDWKSRINRFVGDTLF